MLGLAFGAAVAIRLASEAASRTSRSAKGRNFIDYMKRCGGWNTGEVKAFAEGATDLLILWCGGQPDR